MPETDHSPFELFEDTAQYTVLTIAPDGRVIYASPAFYRLTERDDLTDCNYLGLIDPYNFLGDALSGLQPCDEIRATVAYTSPSGRNYRLRTIIIARDDGNCDVILRDVTDLAAQRQYDRRDELYQALLKSLPGISLLMFDRDRRYLIAEGDDLILSGYPAHELEGMTFNEVFSRGVMGPVYEPLYASALNGDTHELMATIGGQRFLTRAVPIRDEVGDVIAGVIVTQNVTAQHHTQEQLNHSNARYRTLMETNPDLVFVVDQQGRIVEFDTRHLSPAARLMVPEPVRGVNLRDLNMPIRLLNDSLQAIQQALTGNGEVQTVSYETQDENGETLALEARFRAIQQAQGDATREVMVIVRDTSELQRAEQARKLRMSQLATLSNVSEELDSSYLAVDRILELSLDAAIRLSTADIAAVIVPGTSRSPDYRVQVLGDCTEALVRSRADALIDHAVRNLSHRLLPHQDESLFLREFTRHQVIMPLVSRAQLFGIAVLETRRENVFSTPVLRLLQLVMARVAVALDNASLYEQTVEQLNELETLHRQLRDMELLKTKMIYIAGHDIRSPMSVILNVTRDLLERTKGREPEHTLVGYIQSAYNEIQQITDTFLSLEQVRNLSITSPPVAFDLRSVVEATYPVYRMLSERRQQTMTITLPPEPVIVRGWESLIREVIKNLLSNASKYTHADGTGQIDVWLSVRGDRAEFIVRDNGYGVPDSKKGKIFEEFERADSPATEGISGSGMGLAIVKYVIDRHDGAIIFESVYGQGSIFGFELQVMR